MVWNLFSKILSWHLSFRAPLHLKFPSPYLVINPFSRFLFLFSDHALEPLFSLAVFSPHASKSRQKLGPEHGYKLAAHRWRLVWPLQCCCCFNYLPAFKVSVDFLKSIHKVYTSSKSKLSRKLQPACAWGSRQLKPMNSTIPFKPRAPSYTLPHYSLLPQYHTWIVDFHSSNLVSFFRPLPGSCRHLCLPLQIQNGDFDSSDTKLASQRV